ncbi:MAG: hypothetical protein RL011_622 [Pseudomonadota bacterium]|jgi:nucleotide-binding universal stress UspA family protein
MTSSASSPKGCAVVGLSGSEIGQGLIGSAVSLARRFDLKLHIVSVVEPIPFDLVAFDSPAYLAYPPVNLEIEIQRVKEREQALAQLIRELGSKHGLDVTATVRAGAAAPNLIAEATARHANLIMTGYDAEAFRMGASGFTTTLTLMHDASLPVMAVPHSKAIDFSKHNLRLLLADDLQDATREATRKAYEFAASAPGSHLRHVHVFADLQEKLRHAWEIIKERSHLQYGGVGPASEDEVLAQEIKSRKEKLRAQAQPYARAAEDQRVTIEYDLRSGSVERELNTALADHSPDIVFFGRHRIIHTRPMLIGRMSFRAMLHSGSAVVVVPPRSELYAAMPFPAAHA